MDYYSGNERPNSYRIKLDPSEKDVLISKLKSQIIEMEQNEKSYDSLSKKYQKIKQDYNGLYDLKSKLDFELSSVKHDLSNIKLETAEAEERWNLKLKETEKKSKLIFEDNTKLQANVEDLTKSVAFLQKQVDSYVNTNTKLIEEKINLERSVGDLSAQLKQLDVRIYKLTEDNINLNKICEGQDQDLKAFESQITSLKQDNLSLFNTNDELNSRLIEADNEIQKLFADNSKFDRLLHYKESMLSQSQSKIDKYHEDNSNLFDELQRVKHQIILLSDQNRGLMEELDIIKDQDQIIKSHLNRRQKLAEVVYENKNHMQGSII